MLTNKLPYGPLSSGPELLWGRRGREEAELAPSQGSRRGKTRGMDAPKKPKDFIVLSEFSEQVGPVPVVRNRDVVQLFVPVHEDY